MNQERREFQSEHLRLMQALLESIEKQCTMHQHLRGLKESLVSTAARLQVATRVAEEDGSSMAQLRQEAQQAKRRSLEAEKKAANAADLIMNLNNEILNLKKGLKEAGIESHRTESGNTANNGQPYSQDQADDEVDQMMSRFHLDEQDDGDDGMLSSRSRTSSRQQLRRQQSGPTLGGGGVPTSAPVVGSLFTAAEGVTFRPFAMNSNNWEQPSSSRSMPPIDHGFSPTSRRPTTTGSDTSYGQSPMSSSKPLNSPDGMLSPASNASRSPTNRPTSNTNSPFQQWKTDRFVWSPDHIIGSEYYDREAAEVAATLDELEVFKDGITRNTQSKQRQVKAKVFDTTTYAAAIAASTKKITRLPSVELAMANAAMSAGSGGGNPWQVAHSVAGLISPGSAGVGAGVGADGKALSKYHYDKAKFAVKEVGRGDIDKGDNALVTSKLFSKPTGRRGLAV